MKKWTLIVLIALSIVAIFFMFRACKKVTPPERLPIPVSTAKIIQKNVTVYTTSIGNVEAFSSVTIKSQVDGILLSTGFEEGEMVKKGQLLFTIDPRIFQIALDQAKANLTRDRAHLETAKSALDRNTPLVSKGFVSKIVYEQLQNSVNTMIATIKADQAAVENAELQLSHSKIYSPMAGRTGALLLEPGNLVKANETSLVVINQMQPISIEFTLPEDQLSKIYDAFNKRTVEIMISPDKSSDNFFLKATLSFINNAVDVSTGTIQLKATFPNTDLQLWPGQFVKLKIPVEQINNAILAPTEAIQSGVKGSFVFVVDDKNIVHVQLVKIGAEVDGYTVVENAKPGMRVVTVGHLQLNDGDKVKPVDEKMT